MNAYELIRTPDNRFQNLPDYPYVPNYIEGLPSLPNARIHYVDEGGQSANEVFLCLHGAPTWSYIYRKMIPIFLAPGHRVIAPDLLGCGRSDKLVNKSDYSFHLHRNLLLEFVEQLDLKNITLVCQDWGGLLGLTMPMEMPERFSRLLVMNTTINPNVLRFNPTFRTWRMWAKLSPDLEAGRVVQLLEWRLTKQERAAYDAPFPNRRYKAGARAFPSMVPLRPSDEGAETLRKAASWWANEWRGDSFMAIGTKDHALGLNTMLTIQKLLRNCPKPLLVDAGHYVQERGAIIAERALEHFGLN